MARALPLITFFAVACLFTWSLLPAARTSTAISLVALCGPAVAAALAAWGQGTLGGLRRRVTHWRVSPRWYAAALLTPVVVSAAASGFEYLAGAAGPVRLQPIFPLQIIVFALVAGEEIGWRGYALPLLLERTTPWRASVWLGALWALWHLPLFYMPEMPQYDHPIAAFVIYTMSLSILMTWLAQRTGGSVVLATLFHGAVNTFVFVNVAATPVEKGWGNAAAYGLAAALVTAVASSRRQAT